ncbi:MAG: hypothetical protein OXJ90_02455 [Spirochaetaceae bacterium]|nr:hypothetical protein [Spirochaetaceae bacterium]
MEPIPHIDIGGDRHIEEILQDPASAVVDAVTCETLGGWVPDIGLTTYSHRSIYRPPVLARSGLATTLAHRFWRTLEGLMDHTGTRWIGVLIYDQQGEQCPMELEVAGRAVGRLEPIRHDNRRHLIVADRPVEFFGGMEVFQLTAPGPGTYRIEALAFLASRPEPSSFAPTIRHLTARSRPGGVELHFTTDHVAAAELVVRSGETVAGRSRSDRRTKLHAVALDGLAGGDYRCDVTAAGIIGETERASLDVSVRDDTASTALPGGSVQEVSVPVEIVDATEAGHAAAGLPLTFGVPLPRGRLPRALTGRLHAGGLSTPAQCRVHSPWPDGSARWVLVDAVVPAPFPPEEGRIAATVHLAPAAERGPSGRAGGGALLERDGLRIDLSPERPAFPTVLSEREGGAHVPATSAVEVRLANGAALIPRSSAAVQEESGPERSVLRYHVDHCDRDGTPHLRSTIRIHGYRGQRHLRIQHRLEVVSPALGPAAGDPRETPVAVESGAASRGITEAGRTDATATAADVAACVGSGPGEENTLLEVSSAIARIAIPGTRALVADGRRHELAANGHWRLVQADDRRYQVYKVTESGGPAEAAEGRFSGRLLMETEDGLVGLAVRRFWQTCPTGLQVDGDGAAVELLPALTPERTAGQPGADTPDPTDAESWHQLLFWRTNRGYLLKAGQALTGEVAVSLPGSPEEAERIAAWCEQPALVRPAIDWLNGTGVLSPIRAKATSPHPRYERAVDQAYDEWLRERDNLRQYGFLNFGDWYGESGWSWGNNEYDPAFAHYQEFLRGGRAEWAVLAAEAARHLVDVDTCNHSSDPAQVGGQYGHMPGHAGGYLPAYFRSKVACSCMFYSHSWVEGPVLHYLLTGDESVRETLDRIGEWMLGGRTHGVIGGSVVADRQGLDAYDYGQLRDAGWHLIHLCALARWSDDPRFMNAAHLVAERLLERRTPGGGWERLLGEGHCFAGLPRTRGEASFMVGVCLSALRRYHEMTGDERVATAILDGARWLVEHTYDRDAGHFRYTSSPSRGGSGPGHTQQVIEGLVYALSLRHDAELDAIVRRGLDTLGSERSAAEPLALGTPDASTARGVGPSLCHETRYVPTMLAYLSG